MRDRIRPRFVRPKFAFPVLKRGQPGAVLMLPTALQHHVYRQAQGNSQQEAQTESISFFLSSHRITFSGLNRSNTALPGGFFMKKLYTPSHPVLPVLSVFIPAICGSSSFSAAVNKFSAFSPSLSGFKRFSCKTKRPCGCIQNVMWM